MAFDPRGDVRDLSFEGNSALIKIHERAFCSCPSLISVQIPKNVPFISKEGFPDCSTFQDSIFDSDSALVKTMNLLLAAAAI
jgi:hypothetical protein